jgi:hypothetical protein
LHKSIDLLQFYILTCRLCMVYYGYAFENRRGETANFQTCVFGMSDKLSKNSATAAAVKPRGGGCEAGAVRYPQTP